MINFGEQLQRLRLETNLTQKALEEKTGILQANLSSYEKGKIDPSLKVIIRLAEALEVAVADFFPKENDDFVHPVQLNEGIGSMSKEEKDLILDFRGIENKREKDSARMVVKSFSNRKAS